MTVLRRSLRDAAASPVLAQPAARVYEALDSINPRVAVANARYRRHGAPDQLPIPPADLRFLVAGTKDISWFLEGGRLAAQSVSLAAARTGEALEHLDAILDFGCGCGRVLRYWRHLPDTGVFGTDYNAKLVAWSAHNLPFSRVAVNNLEPQLDYDSGKFDLVYALSVFTHLTKDLQAPWVRELARIAKPGGRLVLSTHGEAYLGRLNADERRHFAAGELVVKNNVSAPGSNTCAAYHPNAYVREEMASGLDLVDFAAEGAKGNPRQDLYVLRKPDSAKPGG
jgi:SAM-dependent methyltransferase